MQKLAQYARAAFVTIVAVVLIAQSAAANDTFGPYLRAQRLVDVGNGRHLNIYCSGSGGPTVVLDAGFGSPATGWHVLQPLLVSHVRTCFFERAGYGFSDPGVSAQDTSEVVEDMHAMLHNGHVPGPYVLVAHSLAGFDARLYADRYRPDVAGMVLIAPSEEGDAQFDAIFGKAKDDAESAMVLKIIRGCAKQAHQHRLKIGGACLRPDPSHPPAVQRARLKRALLPGQWDAMVSQWSNFTDDVREVRAEQRDYGRLPLIVLTASAEEDDAKGDGATDKQIAQANALLKRLRAADASHSEIGVSCIVPGVVGEFIQTARPNAVVKAVVDVLREADAGAQARPRTCHYF